MAEGKSTFKEIADKLLLVLVLVLLLASSVYLLLMIRIERGKLKAGDAGLRTSRPIAAQPIDLAAYQASVDRLLNPSANTGPTNRVPFTSEDRVACINPQCQRPIPYDALACPFCAAEQPELEPPDNDQDDDGIPDDYEKDHEMDPYDPRDALMDPDADGFSNREEYESRTDPTDPASRPPEAAKLRITPRGAVQTLIDLTFWGTQRFSADELRFQLNSRERGRSYFAVIGDEIEGYLVNRFLPDAEKGPTLILTKDGNEYSLVKDEPFTFGDWTATLVSLLNARQYRNLKRGSEIEAGGVTYIVVDISRESVIIQNKETGKDLNVGRISPAEAQLLRSRMSMGRGSMRPR
jgi:hypothetical protein